MFLSSKILLTVVLLLIMDKLGFPENAKIVLPQPQLKGTVSLEEAIQNRKSIRNYKDIPLTIPELSQILWAAGGVTCDGVTGATRSYPSAGGCYPLEIYLIAGKVKDLESGLYLYSHDKHSLTLVIAGDMRADLASACWSQPMIKNAPTSIIFTAIYPRTTNRYGNRGERYVHMDVGHAGQNVCLQAETLGLGSVIVGAFDDIAVKKVLKLSQQEEPIYIIPIGKE